MLSDSRWAKFTSISVKQIQFLEIMGFFVLQIFLPALAFAYSSSSSTVDVDDEDDSVTYIEILSFTFGVLLCCCYCTYQNDEEDDYNPEHFVQQPSSNVNIHTFSQQQADAQPPSFAEPLPLAHSPSYPLPPTYA